VLQLFGSGSCRFSTRFPFGSYPYVVKCLRPRHRRLRVQPILHAVPVPRIVRGSGIPVRIVAHSHLPIIRVIRRRHRCRAARPRFRRQITETVIPIRRPPQPVRRSRQPVQRIVTIRRALAPSALERRPSIACLLRSQTPHNVLKDGLVKFTPGVTLDIEEMRCEPLAAETPVYTGVVLVLFV